jgi:hypothetical protein
MPNTREKLIELLSQVQYLGGLEEKIADHLIANGVTVQEWISVKDRLPKTVTNKHLVYCKNGYIGFGHYENFRGEADWYNLENGKPFSEWYLENCETYEVTHWMPLPQPPKGE